MFTGSSARCARVFLALAFAAALVGLTGATARANSPGVNNVSPFFGTYSDSFSAFFLGGYTQLPLFDGMGDLRADNATASIFVTTSSTLSGDTVNARTGKMAGQFGVADYDFIEPATQFG